MYVSYAYSIVRTKIISQIDHKDDVSWHTHQLIHPLIDDDHHDNVVLYDSQYHWLPLGPLNNICTCFVGLAITAQCLNVPPGDEIC